MPHPFFINYAEILGAYRYLSTCIFELCHNLFHANSAKNFIIIERNHTNVNSEYILRRRCRCLCTTCRNLQACISFSVHSSISS